MLWFIKDEQILKFWLIIYSVSSMEKITFWPFFFFFGHSRKTFVKSSIHRARVLSLSVVSDFL